MQGRFLIYYLVLFCGVLAVASASIMIRMAQGSGVPTTVIAAGRLGFAAIIMLPIVLWRAGPELRALRRQDLLMGVGAGACLAIHFLAWISSLEYTSVASSVALVATNPLWVGLASLLLFRERLAPRTVLSVLLTLGGSVLIGLSDGSGAGGKNPLLGDALALGGGLAASCYLLLGRSLRRRLSVLAYVGLAYSSAAVILLLVVLATQVLGPTGARSLLGYPPVAYALLLGLALLPQIFGHTAFNWVLRYLSATFVAVTILGEPVGAALLALVLFHERFALLQLLGFALLLFGIVIAALEEGARKAPRGTPAGAVAAQEPADEREVAARASALD